VDSLSKLEKQIGVKFRDDKLLREAVTHRSYINESRKSGLGHNERLEFLGDAVLELVVTENLFKAFPEKEEGELTVYRSVLVNAKTLSAVAKAMRLDDAIMMSKGEAKESLKSRGRETILANAFEAVIGAVYLDSGYESVKGLIEKFVMPKLQELGRAGGKDAKSLVQESAQSNFKITPTYKVIEESGPAHERFFRVGLYFGSNLKSEGAGQSKQEAELAAAEKWIEDGK